MYTREAFERQRAVAKQAERRAGLPLVSASVGLGLGQLAFIRWIEGRVEHRRAIAMEGAIFLAYLALVGWLAWRMQRRLRAARAICPGCGAVLQGLSERIAVATGRCDTCGAQVVEP